MQLGDSPLFQEQDAVDLYMGVQKKDQHNWANVGEQTFIISAMATVLLIAFPIAFRTISLPRIS